MMTRLLLMLALTGLLFPISFTAVGQEAILLPEAEYDRLKLAGQLPPNAHPISVATQEFVGRPPTRGGQPKGGGGGLPDPCDCWKEPDSSYTMVNNGSQWNASGFQNADDGSHGPIALPFQFNLYNDLHSSVYININGNISFGNYYGTFTASGFPSAQFVMVAPFWGDVDLRPIDENGFVYFKVTPTAFYVNWVDVGYFNQQGDKRNTFQVIITDGTDPVIGVGNTVAFCYQDMQWTTGSASGGVNGFGGTAATVGANRGNGVDFIQFGRFDQPGDAYDGPFGNNDGIDWLDFKNFQFNTAVSTQNIPPIASSQFLCDTITVCVGESFQLDMEFLSPENDQTTTATSFAPSLSTYTEVTNTSGITALVVGEFTPQPGEEGFHLITFTGTDDGDPPLTSTVDIVVQVLPAPPDVVITGSDVVCEGQLAFLNAVPGDFDSYFWSNGAFGPNISVTQGGTYTVSAGTGPCLATSPPFEVTLVLPPTPIITGQAASCAGEPAEITTSTPYADYEWSTGETTPSVSVESGTYTVTVTNDAGCTGTSSPFTVIVDNDPTAFFTAVPPSPQLPGVAVDFQDGSDGNGGTITSWVWTIGDPPQIIEGPGADAVFNEPGNYLVTLTVSTANGCTDTYEMIYVVQPAEIFIPNVFSPNNDGLNDFFVVENLQFFPNSRLVVYSRWGNVVYESNSYQNNWRAQGVSEGTYFYTLYMPDGRDYQGHVTIVR